MRRSRALLVVFAVLCGLTGCVGGAPDETAAGSLSTLSPRLVNRALSGIWVNDTPSNGPIRQLTLGTCWMSIDFFDGSNLSGGYYAYGPGIVYGGVLQHTIDSVVPAEGSPISTVKPGTTHVWGFQGPLPWAEGVDEPVNELALQGFDAPGIFGERTLLRRSTTTIAGLSVDADQRPEDWCMEAPQFPWQPPPTAVTPGLRVLGDRTVVAPSGHIPDNPRLRGIWAGDGLVKELHIGPCYMEIDLRNGDWIKGNHFAYTATSGTQRRGTIDIDVAEEGRASWAREGGTQVPGSGPAWVSEPIYAEVLGVSLEPTGDAMDIILKRGTPERLTRVGSYPESPGERWCWSSYREE